MIQAMQDILQGKGSTEIKMARIKIPRAKKQKMLGEGSIKGSKPFRKVVKSYTSKN